MDLRDLVDALLAFDHLAARQWVADAMRAGMRWADLPRPSGLDDVGMAIAAGVAEMLAGRTGQSPPSWTREVHGSPQRLYLVREASRMPRLRRLCEDQGPEPLRRRGLLAPPEFLTIA